MTSRVGCVLACLLFSRWADAQIVSQRGFVEARADAFPAEAPRDSTRVVGDVLLRQEVFAKPRPWLQLAAGADLRVNSHDQIDGDWGVDVSDRSARRPRLSLRRATATFIRGPLTLDVGKQFIRWGKADILNPTDRFAPRDFLNVVSTEFLPVAGMRAAVQATKGDVFEAVWLPRFTPSRIPLFGQRWTALPADVAPLQVVEGGAVLPRGAQAGVRWSHVGERAEYSVSFFDGFNHLPTIEAFVGSPTASAPRIEIVRRYPAIRSYGADLALPTRWFIVKGEMAYVASSDVATDEYVTYVVQLERQTGEWVLVGGYAGEVVTEQRVARTFAPDRGLTRAVTGRASYTIDTTRSMAFETAIRQNLAGAYGRVEYSQAYGPHWRATAAAIVVGGAPDDFLGQYRRNSHISFALRYSY